jgi:hypothetical protein
MGTMRLPLLILHILAGSIGLLTGAVAMAVRKGGTLHRASGNVFTVAMLTLATSAAAEFQAGSASLGTCGACATDFSLRQALSFWVSSKFSRRSCAAPYS